MEKGSFPSRSGSTSRHSVVPPETWKARKGFFRHSSLPEAKRAAAICPA